MLTPLRLPRYTDGTTEEYYLRARPHLLLEDGRIVALSNGLRPSKASESVLFTAEPNPRLERTLGPLARVFSVSAGQQRLA